MSPLCTASIALKSRGPFEPGSVIEGEAIVDVNVDIARAANGGVIVELRWHTHGKGDIDAVRVAGGRVPAARAWEKGEQVRVPFALPIPDRGAPATVRGALVNLDWYVRASVDVDGSPAAADVDVIVDGPSLAAFSAIDAPPPPGHGQKARNVAPVSAVAALASIGVAVAVGSPMVYDSDGFHVPDVPDASGWFALAMPMLFFVLPLGAIAVAGAKTVLAHSFLARASLSVTPKSAAGGDDVSAVLDVPAHRHKRITSVDAALVCRERVDYQHGSSRANETHERQRIPIAMKSEPGRYVGRLHLPVDAAWSLHTENNHVEWIVVVTPQVRGMPDPTFEIELPVRRSAPPSTPVS